MKPQCPAKKYHYRNGEIVRCQRDADEPHGKSDQKGHVNRAGRLDPIVWWD